MKCFIGLGSNLGNRKENLEKAANELARISNGAYLRVARVYETPALVPPNAPIDWRTLPYLNTAAEIDWAGSAEDLLRALKGIEKKLGRQESSRWAPRVLDLDLLSFGSETVREEHLQVPHPGISERSFVLDPLKDLAPSLILPGASLPLVRQARELAAHSPWILGIFNLTPDSFSDGGALPNAESLRARLREADAAGLQAIDLGAESTRPGAFLVSAEEEWQRLRPALEIIQAHYAGQRLRPWISVDTRRAETAQRALELGVDAINDVSGLADPAMLAVLRQSSCEYILMHSLSIPADPKVAIPMEVDPVATLKDWLSRKLDLLQEEGISPSRAIFDPGIGFGKTAFQSLTILRRIDEFTKLPVRLLIGHSRKSFLKSLSPLAAENREAATLALSLELARRGVDILRVHDFASHLVALRARSEVLP